MQLIHNSRDTVYREPFGAQQCGDSVTLRVEVQDDMDRIDFVLVNYAVGLEHFTQDKIMLQKVETPEQNGTDFWETTLRMPGIAGLFFYWFEIRLKDHSYLYLTRNPNNDATGIITNQPAVFLPESGEGPRPWQVTVYERGFEAPDWFEGGIIYQIFPDRFQRGSDYRFEAMAEYRDDPERIYHQDWGEEVDIHGSTPEGYLACDFFGGTLRGITERLDYLAQLNIRIIYLNPIFKARSNHRYDTADYTNVDPLLGTNEDFEDLCRAAADKGIRIILDGVFSHTGADSIYFDKFGRYGSEGAYGALVNKTYSPYFNWYNLHQKDQTITYDSWWGFPELPAVNELSLTFRDHILGKDGVIRTWLRRGASGFRLDVSDELPDEFIIELRRVMKDEKSDSIILGEVWEDASNKISYGRYRDFLLGNTHDSVMGYPFRDAMVAFMRGEIAADQFDNGLETIRENYPPAAFNMNMNLISSHDTARFITAVAGDPDPGSREEQQKRSLSPEQRLHGEKLLRLAVFMQMTYPGNPGIYYGDELGMEGYRDPFNRRTMPWHQVGQSKLLSFYRALTGWRESHKVLGKGKIRTLIASGRLLVYERYLSDREEAAPLDEVLEAGPERSLCVVNVGSEPLRLSLQDRQLLVEPYSAYSFCEGQTLSVNEEGTSISSVSNLEFASYTGSDK